MSVKPLNKRYHRKCRACRRPLTSKKSRKIGFGPDCAKKYGGLTQMERAERDGQMRLFE